MTIFIANAICSERKYRIERTDKLKKLNETLVIGGRNYESLNSESYL